MSVTAAVAQPGAAHGARVPRLPPPLYYAAAFVAGTQLSRTTITLTFAVSPATRVSGAVLIACGAGLGGSALAAVIRRKTTVVPHREVTALLTDGPYRFSRNPMYTGLAVAYLGGVLLVGSWGPLLTLPVALLAVRVLVIGPEERYLARRFPAAYAHYRAGTRRWL